MADVIINVGMTIGVLTGLITVYGVIGETCGWWR